MIEGHGDDTYRYGHIRLNFSSNIPAYTDLSGLEAHLSRHLSLIRNYPEPSPRSLEAKIAHSIGRNPSQVLVTSGATEAIYLIAQSARTLFPGEGGPTYTVVQPTFSEYESACQMFGLREGADGDICWLCNPNNPTGEVRDEAYVRRLLRHHRLLVIDQSYEDYTQSPLPDLGDLTNVVVLHSMTKRYCIPGLRLGYVTGAPEVIEVLRRCGRPWSVNALAQEAGAWLVEHSPRLVDIGAYLREAQRLREALNGIPGIEVAPTQTNFMLATIRPRTAAELKAYLAEEHGILIRDASNFRGLSVHHFRVAAQRPEDDDALVGAIRQYMA